MRVPIKVVLETDGEEQTEVVIADSRDVRAYEAEFGSSFLTTDLSVTQITQLAFCALRRLGRFKGSWDVFDASAIDVEGANDEEGEVETAPPYPEGSRGRLITALAIRTGIAPSVLEQEPEAAILTMIDLLTVEDDRGSRPEDWGIDPNG